MSLHNFISSRFLSESELSVQPNILTYMLAFQDILYDNY